MEAGRTKSIAQRVSREVPRVYVRKNSSFLPPDCFSSIAAPVGPLKSSEHTTEGLNKSSKKAKRVMRDVPQFFAATISGCPLAPRLHLGRSKCAIRERDCRSSRKELSQPAPRQPLCLWRPLGTCSSKRGAARTVQPAAGTTRRHQLSSCPDDARGELRKSQRKHKDFMKQGDRFCAQLPKAGEHCSQPELSTKRNRLRRAAR
jgi:hypothetical protein